MDPPQQSDDLSPAPAPSRDLLIHNVKKIEGMSSMSNDIGENNENHRFNLIIRVDSVLIHRSSLND